MKTRTNKNPLLIQKDINKLEDMQKRCHYALMKVMEDKKQKTKTELAPLISELNSSAQELNKFSYAEGAQATASATLNMLLDLTDTINELKQENAAMRKRITALESGKVQDEPS